MTSTSTRLICLAALYALCAGCEEGPPTFDPPAPDPARVDGGATGLPDAMPDETADAGAPGRDAMPDREADAMPDPDAGPAPDGGSEPGCVDPGEVIAVFATRCAFAGCHGGGSASGGLSLDRAGAFDALIGQASSQQPGMLRVAAGDVAGSYLAVKLDPDPPVGSQMPLGGMLDGGERALIDAWIAAGAPTEACDDPGPDPSDVARVEVDDGVVRLGIGEVTRLVARPVDADGAPVEAPVVWRSDNGIIAYSDHTGGVLGVGTGETTLRAVADGIESAPVPVVVVDATPPGASFFGEVDPMFRQRCAVPGCHVDDIEPGDLRFDRDPDRMWEELVEDDAEQVDRPRVRPGSPAGSYLVQKLALDQPEVGGRMPLGQPPLAVGDMQRIVTWIKAGAPAN